MNNQAEKAVIPSIAESLNENLEIIGENMPRKNVRRAASKEALKQMQLLSATAAAYEDEDPTETYEIESDDDDDEEDVAETFEMPPKKKYKLTHRKSSDDRELLVLSSVDANDDILQLEVFPEELSPAQLSFKNKCDSELQELNTKIDSICQQSNVEMIYQGETCSALEIDATVLPLGDSTNKKTITKALQPKNVVLQSNNNSNSFQVVVDQRLGLIVGTMTPTSNPPPLTPVVSTNSQNAVVTPPVRQTRRRGRNSVAAQISTPPTLIKKPGRLHKSSATKKASPAVSVRTTEATAVGGLSTVTPPRKPNNTVPSSIVDLTTDDGRPLADSREISFNKLQGKTFPSLVVVARPHLSVKDVTGGDRSKLDAKVKSVLMYIPTKFTEWLIQQGLIKSEQNCVHHPTTKLKLGMYSDVTKFPFSGGYVWISECCPHRFVSVYSGSLFDSSPHPPSVILKLIYHWSCQTNVQNVVQWVRVDNSYIKLVNSWLRAICTVGLHTHVGRLGGPGVKIEVGVISLGTTSQDGKERKVKVEVLGLLEPKMKRIRLRAVEPIADSDCDYKKRFAKILEPLLQWVHPESTIVTDLTVDKSTLTNMGFVNVQQSPSTDQNPSNQVIMEYLRRIVPRMFQNTLSLLSRQIIQQFLDELVWREWFGSTTADCFDNILLHLSEQTRSDTSLHPSLTTRLAKVSANPFKNWSINVNNQTAVTVSKADSASIPSKRSSTRRKIMNVRMSSPVPEASQLPQQPTQRPPRTISPDIPEQMVPLENYYYGTIEGDENNENAKATWNMKCSMCKLTFNNNIKLMTHLFSHAHSITSDTHQCRYCLSSVRSADGLSKHISSSHPNETRFEDEFSCIICEIRFKNSLLLGRHLSKEHVPSELPYKCGTCGHRCSSHRQAIDHFYKAHNSGNTIQCPFCLKSTVLFSGGRLMPQNLNFFMQHLQKHQKKAMAKKCAKCALWFIHKENLKDHQLNMHSSQRRKAGLLPWVAPRNSLMVPKSKQDKQVWEDADREFNFSNLTINASSKMLCKECKTSVGTPQHYQALESCTNRNCQYLTCCKNAMDHHATVCEKLNNSLPNNVLKTRMHCICGFSVDDGNLLAKHLAECERKSAYPTAEAAKSAIKTHSMLDVLGLVRRPEEPTAVKTLKRPRSTLEVINLDDDDDMEVVPKSKKNKFKEDIGFKISEPVTITDEDEKDSVTVTISKVEEKLSETITIEDDKLSEEEEDKVVESIPSNKEESNDTTMTIEEESGEVSIANKETLEEKSSVSDEVNDNLITPITEVESLEKPEESVITPIEVNKVEENCSKSKKTQKIIVSEIPTKVLLSEMPIDNSDSKEVNEENVPKNDEDRKSEEATKENVSEKDEECSQSEEATKENVSEKDEGCSKSEEVITETVSEKDEESKSEESAKENASEKDEEMPMEINSDNTTETIKLTKITDYNNSKDIEEIPKPEESQEDQFSLVENIENIEKYLESTEVRSNNAFTENTSQPKNNDAIEVAERFDSPKLFDDLTKESLLVERNSDESSNNLNFDAIAELIETDK